MDARALLLILLGAAACSTSSAPGETPVDAGGDTSPACTSFGCNATITPEELDASLEVRVRTRLGACNGTEGCHVDGVEGLNYPPGNEFIELIGVPSQERPDLLRVKPGDPSASYLFLKTLGDGGIEGGRMPLGYPWDPRIPATIFEWIEAGAAHD